MLLTTHYLDEAAELADRVGVVAGGRLVEVAPPDELGAELRRQATVRWTEDGARARGAHRGAGRGAARPARPAPATCPGSPSPARAWRTSTCSSSAPTPTAAPKESLR